MSIHGFDPMHRASLDGVRAGAKVLTSAPGDRVGSAREFPFTSSDFERIRALIKTHAGIVLPPTKQDMVYGRLARRLRARGMRSFAEYVDCLKGDRQEWQAFVNALTTNLTSFFREQHHFEILAQRMRQPGRSGVFSIWCCAASTGEEPYSLAMTACEAFDSLRPPVQILASDINTEVLAQGQNGCYGADRVEGLAPERIRKYFIRQGAEYQVRAELRQLVTFSRVNLLESSWPVRGPFDAIFCRNVMIYFDKETQLEILKRFVPLIRKEGALFAGNSESFLHAVTLFKALGRTVYQPVSSQA